MNDPRILVALATYNEIENLPSLVESILKILPTADVLVVDDNSPDGTGAWCDAEAEHNPRLHCLHRAAKLGLGTAALEAIQYAIKHDYDVFITLDADWSHDPSHLPTLVESLDEADVAIGSRYCPGGAIENWPWRRRLMSRWLNGLTRAMLRVPIKDTSGAYRAYRVAKLREIDWSDFRASGYSYLEEMVWHLSNAKARFIEVPITFRDRRAGASKIDVREARHKLGTLCSLVRRRHKPNG